MTLEKEIRAVALYMIEPDKGKVDDMLSSFEKLRPMVKIRYAKDNAFDSTCMEIMYGLKRIGYVPSEEKRYVAPLLKNDAVCNAEFLEVVRHEGHTPVVRFLIQVDLDDVEPLHPGEAWKDWGFSFPTLPMIEDLTTVNFTGNILKNIIEKKVQDDSVTIEELVQAFTNASLFDMSVETTSLYDDITFYLEIGRRANRQFLDILQHGSMIRRTDKVRTMFLEKWWPSFLTSEAAMRLCKNFCTRIVSQYGALSEPAINEEMSRLEHELVLMPYSLYDDIDNIGVLWSKLFYTNVPREKFLAFLSGLVLHCKLKDWKENKTPFIENDVTKQYIQNYEKGSMARVVNF